MDQRASGTGITGQDGQTRTVQIKTGRMLMMS